jgi:hypothetical protein
MQKIVLLEVAEKLQKEMLKFFLRTSIPRKKAANKEKGGKKHE